MVRALNSWTTKVAANLVCNDKTYDLEDWKLMHMTGWSEKWACCTNDDDLRVKWLDKTRDYSGVQMNKNWHGWCICVCQLFLQSLEKKRCVTWLVFWILPICMFLTVMHDFFYGQWWSEDSIVKMLQLFLLFVVWRFIRFIKLWCLGGRTGWKYKYSLTQ